MIWVLHGDISGHRGTLSGHPRGRIGDLFWGQFVGHMKVIFGVSKSSLYAPRLVPETDCQTDPPDCPPGSPLGCTLMYPPGGSVPGAQVAYGDTVPFSKPGGDLGDPHETSGYPRRSQDTPSGIPPGGDMRVILGVGVGSGLAGTSLGPVLRPSGAPWGVPQVVLRGVFACGAFGRTPSFVCPVPY